jgi:hypothetical protein
MLRRPWNLLALPLLVLPAACGSAGSSDGATRQRDYGTGLNTVDKKYAKPAPMVYDAAVAAVKHFDLEVEQNRGDSLGGEVVARRAGGDRVTVKVRSLDANTSSASVRVEPGNRNMAEMIHARMASEVGLGTAKTGWLGGGNVLSSTYAAALPACAAAAENACRKLNLNVTGRDVQPAEGHVEARSETSIPVRVNLTRKDETRTAAEFVAGSEKTPEGKALVERLKAEFDAQLAPRGY